jgi:hypothetical protein
MQKREYKNLFLLNRNSPLGQSQMVKLRQQSVRSARSAQFIEGGKASKLDSEKTVIEAGCWAGAGFRRAICGREHLEGE